MVSGERREKKERKRSEKNQLDRLFDLSFLTAHFIRAAINNDRPNLAYIRFSAGFAGNTEGKTQSSSLILLLLHYYY